MKLKSLNIGGKVRYDKPRYSLLSNQMFSIMRPDIRFDPTMYSLRSNKAIAIKKPDVCYVPTRKNKYKFKKLNKYLKIENI